MTIKAFLSIDNDETLNIVTEFEARPEIGELLRCWSEDAKPIEAKIVRIAHHRVAEGFYLSVEAETIKD